MSAADHLNPTQFMAVSDAVNLKSMNMRQLGVPDNSPEQSVGQWVDDYRAHPPSLQRHELDASVAEHGVQEPVDVWSPNGKPSWMMEGHHRIASAMSAGQTHIPVNHHPYFSPDDHTPVDVLRRMRGR